MSFRDDRDAQRHRVEALEREVEALREDLAVVREERDHALVVIDRLRVEPDAPSSGLRFGVGAAVCVEWSGTWWNATVVSIVGPDSWRIHYDGWSSRWDENVGPARILPRSAKPSAWGSSAPRRVTIYIIAASVAIAAGIVLLSRPSEPVVSTAGPVAHYTGLPGTPVPASTRLSIGAPVWVEWNSSWYPALVLEPLPDHRARVHYEGYSDAYDETVTPERIRHRHL